MKREENLKVVPRRVWCADCARMYRNMKQEMAEEKEAQRRMLQLKKERCEVWVAFE